MQSEPDSQIWLREGMFLKLGADQAYSFQTGFLLADARFKFGVKQQKVANALMTSL